MKFVGRKKELEQLKNLYETSGYKGLKVYGRRQIGKTYLLKYFCSDKHCVYFTANSISVENNYELLRTAVADFLATYNVPEDIEEKFRDAVTFYDMLSVVFELGMFYNLVFVIDEYNYLAEAEGFTPQIFQRIIDDYRDKSNIFLILCGSNVGVLEHIDDYNAPLFGRIMFKQAIKPFTAVESLAWLKDYSSLDERVKAAMICSGFPTVLGYAEKFTNLKDLATFLLSPLYDNLDSFCNSVLKADRITDLSKVNDVLEAICKGSCTPAELKTALIESQGCLNSLLHVGVICTKSPMFSRHLKNIERFCVSDNMFALNCLWKKLRNVMSVEEFLKSQYLADFFGHAFEGVCCDFILGNGLGYIPDSIGYWEDINKGNKNTREELDIVAVSDYYKQVLCCECKFRGSASAYSIVDANKLLKRASLVDHKFNKRVCVVFSRTKFSKDVIDFASENNIKLFTLDDMFEKSDCGYAEQTDIFR